jgi:RNA polymerase sigma-70 factor (ECF subfamily)
MPTAAPLNLLSPRIGGEDNDARFNRVVLPHLADAHALARWLTGNDSDAHDVVQEASIRALRGIGTYANGNARAWVLTIVRYTAYDWLHQNRSPAVIYVDRLEDLEGVQPTDPEASTPETVLIRHENERQLAAAISVLPVQFREALLLRDVQGLTYRDIAERIGVSIGTVMSRLFRARRQLTSLLNPNGEQRTQGAGLAPTPGINARRRQSPPMPVCNGDDDADSSETLRLSA